MGVSAAAAIGRARASRGVLAASPSIDPWTAEFADSSAGRASDCPEIDCVRSLLAADVIDDAECRAATLSDLGLPRLARPVAQRPAVDSLDSAVDAGALAAALAGGLARTLSARRRTLRLGKDRARAGEKLAASRHYDAVARRAGALSQRAQGIRRIADPGA